MNAAFTPLPEASAPSEAGTVFACSLCGCRFTHGGEACSACPISRGCDLVRCPGCGFQFPRSSRVTDSLIRLWRKWRTEP